MPRQGTSPGLTRIKPHTHQLDENIVVVKGGWAQGMGTHFDRDAVEPMAVGDYGITRRWLCRQR
jgi:hypothetical protein